jgi:hypothetical protein
LVTLTAMMVLVMYAVVLLGWGSGYRRRRRWRLHLASEYYGGGDSDTDAGKTARALSYFSFTFFAPSILRRLARAREGDRRDNLKYARRATILKESSAALVLLYITGFVTWALVYAAWFFGYAKAAHEVSNTDAINASTQDAWWNLANALPVFELPDTFHWERPTLFADDARVSVIFLVMKIVLVAPLVRAFIEAVDTARFEPDQWLTDDTVIENVIGALASTATETGDRSAFARAASFGKEAPYRFAFDWDAAIVKAVEAMNSGITQPDEEWTPQRVVDHVNQVVDSESA